MEFDILAMILIGLVTGLMTGLTGASGVGVVVPMLTILLGFSIYEAIGTSLVVDIVASLAVTITYLKHGQVDRTGAWIALGSILGAQLGALIATRLPEGGLTAGFGLGMILMGIVIWRRNGGSTAPAGAENDAMPKQPFGQIAKAILLGFGIGIMTGITGAGGGIMILFVLILVLKFPMHKAIGTSTMIMAITALSGAIGYSVQGQIDIGAGVVVGLGAVVGGVASARLANTYSEQKLARVAGSIFMVLGVTMTIIQFTGVGFIAHG